jgi:glycosyltransferase involved in cell wall biosynthesis
MNLLFFADAGYPNGVGPLLVDQIKAIHHQYNEVYAVVSSKESEPNLIQSIMDENIPVLHLAGLEYHRNFNIHIKQLLGYIITNNIRVVHVQSNWQLAVITVVKFCLLLKHRLKIIYTIHSYRNNKSKHATFARIIIGSLLFLFADKIICSCNFLKRKFRLLSYKIVVLPLGMSPSFFTDREECPVDCLRLIFPAQFRIGKNQDILIEAFSEYIRNTKDKNSCLYLPGSGTLLESMKNLAQELNIAKQVIFPGQCTIEEIKQYYYASNIAVVPSDSETFGYCIVEPFVLGRCIITRHVGVADDIIKDGVNGYFFDTKDDLVKLLQAIAQNKQILSQMGKYNFEHGTYKWETITTRYLEIIMNIVPN